LCRTYAEAAPEVAVKVALVGEADHPGHVGGAVAALQEPPGEIHPQRNLVGVRRDADRSVEAAYELILAGAGGGCQLIQRDIPRDLVVQELHGGAYRRVVARNLG
jgi:hypothetical protein